MRFKEILIFMFCFQTAIAQETDPKDSINNLILPAGYETGTLGAIPSYTMSGKGKQSMVLVHGLGFDGSIFDDFKQPYLKRFKIYSITLPGFGGTPSPPLPPMGTSYGEQVWNKGAIEGIKNLIVKEHLVKPVLVGHFTMGVQLVMRFAILHPDLIGGVILIGGPAKFLVVQDGKTIDYSLDFRIKAIDGYMAPKFYKTIKKEVFDENNYQSELYSTNKALGNKLWEEPTKVQLPIMIQYLCEFFAADLTLDIAKITVPMLVIRPGFHGDLLTQPTNPMVNYIKPQFIDAWDKCKEQNPRVTIMDIKNSGVFLWKDQPEATYQIIIRFMGENIKKKAATTN